MDKLTDEILNKLIDNQLSSSEIDELHDLIKNNKQLLSKTKAHQMVDSLLKKTEVENAPANTTELIMKKIINSCLVKDKTSGFFKVMISIFAVSIMAVIGLVFKLKLIEESNSETFYHSYVSKIVEYFSNLSVPFNSEIVMVITSASTVVVLISLYFVFEEHKSFKQKLDSIL